MAGAILVGNIALMADAALSRQPTLERAKIWPLDPSPINRSKRDSPPPVQFVFSAVSSSDGHQQSSLFGNKSWRTKREQPKLRTSATGPSELGEIDEESEKEEEEKYKGWEQRQEEFKKRTNDKEDMKELENLAEKLTKQADEDDSDETEEEKRERVRRELAKVAKEQAERRASATFMFELGKKAYSKGMYAKAIEFLEASLTIIPGPTLLGGEIQIWLAMAFEANKRRKDCIELYKDLETRHPAITIRRQAADLRYILQAPKLKISKEEYVTMPLIGSRYDSYAATWSGKYKDQEKRKKASEARSSPYYFGDSFLSRLPSDWQKNRNLWGIVTLWVCLVLTALYLQR